MWILQILALGFLYRNYLADVIQRQKKKPLAILLIAFILPLEFHIESIVFGHRSAGNIYYQQYQMHRYVTEYYRDGVAVNDLGWVSFGNRNYVLDLWGLASREAHRARTEAADTDTQWLTDMVNDHAIGLVMIYHNQKYFPQVPGHWIKIGELKLKDKKFTVSDTKVHFFASKRTAIHRIESSLEKFVPTLPEGATFEYVSR